VAFLDARRRIEFVSLGQAEETGALEDVEPSLRHRSFHLIPRVEAASSGADALAPLARLLLPGGSVVSMALEAIPACRRAISFCYSTLSRLHDTGRCGTAARTGH